MSTALADRTRRMRARLLDRQDKLLADAEAALEGADPDRGLPIQQRRVVARLLDDAERVDKLLDCLGGIEHACAAGRREPTTVERRKLHEVEAEAGKLLV